MRSAFREGDLIEGDLRAPRRRKRLATRTAIDAMFGSLQRETPDGMSVGRWSANCEFSDGMGMFVCPCCLSCRQHGQEYLPMPPIPYDYFAAAVCLSQFSLLTRPDWFQSMT